MNTSASIAASSNWPCIDARYLFAADNNNIAINIFLSFDAFAYKNNAVVDGTKVTADLLFYQKLKTSLENKELKISYTTTIEADDKGNAVVNDIDGYAVLAQLVLPIISYLEGLLPKPEIETDTAKNEIPPPQPFLIEKTLSAAALKNTANVFKLSTVLEIVNTVTNTAISLQIQPQSSSDSVFNLQDFAQQVEVTFINFGGEGSAYKIAANTSDNAVIPAMWVLKTDTTGKSGIKVDVTPTGASVYAPIPLNNSLQSFSTSVNIYETGKPYPAGQITSANFSSIDATLWAKDVLTALQQLFTPNYLGSITLLSGKGSIAADYIKNITVTKQKLTQLVSSSVVNIISNNTVTFAQQQWQRYLNPNLSIAYSDAMVISLPATVTKPGDTNEGLLCGEISVTDENNTLTLSQGVVPIQNGAGAFTFSVTPNPNFDYSPVTTPAAIFTPQYLSVDDEATLLPFIIPFKGSFKLAPVTVPLPCYGVPVTPILALQSITDSSIVSDDGAMPTAFTWDYHSNFNLTTQVGDVTTIKVNFNKTEANNLSAQSGNSNLLYQSLAQCITVLPQLKADFENYLEPITSENIDKYAENASIALQTFATVTNALAQNWNSKRLQHSEAPVQLSGDLLFELTQEKQTATNNLLVKVTPKNDAATRQKIQLSIDGFTTQRVDNTTNTFVYKSADGDYLLWQNRNKFNNYILTVEGLNILNIQNANNSYQTERNMGLMEGAATNPQFLLNGNEVEFGNAITALIEYPLAINMALLLGVENFELVKYIDAFFSKLFANTVAQLHTVAIKVTYNYTIPPLDVVVSSPVALIPPSTINNNDKEFNNGLSDIITSWFNSVRPEYATAKFTFELTVYTETNSPLLQMQAFLPIDKIKNLGK